MGFKPKTPDFTKASLAEMAGRKNDELESFLRATHDRLNILEQRSGVETINTGKPGVITQAPPKAKLEVSGVPNAGIWTVGVHEPQFIGRGNDARRALYHHIEYSPYQDFSKQVTALPIGHQTYMPVYGQPGQTLYFRVRSSYDGQTWNDHVLSGAKKA